MSRFDYLASQRLILPDPPFAALIMAAHRRADTANAAKLRREWPEIVAELEARYHAPGGYLPGDAGAPQTPDLTTDGESVVRSGHHEHVDTRDNVTDPDVLGAYGIEPDWVPCQECGDRFHAAGEDRTVCDDCDMTEPDDEPHYYVCPTCGGNGCGPCRGTGERLDTSARAR